MTATSQPLPLPLTNKQLRWRIMRCWVELKRLWMELISPYVKEGIKESMKEWRKDSMKESSNQGITWGRKESRNHWRKKGRNQQRKDWKEGRKEVQGRKESRNCIIVIKKLFYLPFSFSSSSPSLVLLFIKKKEINTLWYIFSASSVTFLCPLFSLFSFKLPRFK